MDKPYHLPFETVNGKLREVKPMFTKMCDDPRIQDGWVPKVGDRAYVSTLKQEVCIVSLGSDFTVQATNIDRHDQAVAFIGQEGLIYLPSIKDLMGMVWNKEEEDPGHLMGKVGDFFYSDKYPGDPDSMQELWLAFVFHKLHNGLKWSGERWE